MHSSLITALRDESGLALTGIGVLVHYPTRADVARWWPSSSKRVGGVTSVAGGFDSHALSPGFLLRHIIPLLSNRRTLYGAMTKARTITPTVTFVDEYCALFQDLFPDVRSFEQFKFLHLGMLADLPRKSLPAIAKAVGQTKPSGAAPFLDRLALERHDAPTAPP